MQAGTQFWDESLAREVEQNRISEATLDRYVSFKQHNGDSLFRMQVVNLLASQLFI